MTEFVGKIERDELCEGCHGLIRDGQREVWLCDHCTKRHGADVAVAVNSTKVNLLVEEVSDGHGYSDVHQNTA